jgi:cytochrome c oxidase assembly protein subunit 15
MSGPSSGTRAPGAAGADGAGEGRGVHLFALCLAAWTFVLLTVGGVVTGKEAGLSVPDWPLSYGTINPPNWTRTPNVFEEHLHRLLGWGVGLLVVLLVVLLHRRDRRPWMRRLGWAVLGTVIAQGVIGGYFRVVLLQHGMAVVHGVLGQAFFCLVVAVALFTSPGWRDAPAPVEDAGARRLRLLSLAAAVAFLLQVVIGALIRHSRIGHSFLHVLPHAAWGVLCAVLAFSCRIQASRVAGGLPALRRPALLLDAGTGIQILLGLGAYLANTAGFEERVRPHSQVAASSVHQAFGAILLAAAVVLHLRARRLLRDPEAAHAAAPAGGGAPSVAGARP